MDYERNRATYGRITRSEFDRASIEAPMSERCGTSRDYPVATASHHCSAYTKACLPQLGDEPDGKEIMATPSVSIILPTFNRMKFIRSAISSIQNQSWQDWELIVVDDGSTDETVSLLSELTREFATRVSVITQENSGPGIARNTGIKASKGTYIAFYDSDDTWETEHLSECVEALNDNSDVDWVYANFRRANFEMNLVIDPDEFHKNGIAAKFLGLKVEHRGKLKIIHDDFALSCMIEHGLCIGLRTSVVRRDVFRAAQFPETRIGEDQALYIRALARGVRFGYLECVHATAFVHESNISNVSGKNSVDHSVAVQHELLKSLKILIELPMSKMERRSLYRRIAMVLFWNIGYVYATSENYLYAEKYMREGIFWYPKDLSFWKTYVTTFIRRLLRKVRRTIVARVERGG